jgi:hypothetical protein
VESGTYTVTLHFAENYYAAAGQRIFSVNIEGAAINNLDVFAEAGGAHVALRKTVSVTVTDGRLNIIFSPLVDQPMINAIEVVPH